MKSIIKHAICILTCSFLLSCNQEKATKDETSVVDKIVSYESHVIEEEDASNGLKAYKSYIELVQNNLSKNNERVFKNNPEKLNYGSEVDLKEFREILLNHRFKNNDKLFLMNALRPKIDKKGDTIEGEYVTEIIFVLESKLVSESKTETDTIVSNTYFDFTRPCPTGCPEGIPDITYAE